LQQGRDVYRDHSIAPDGEVILESTQPTYKRKCPVVDPIGNSIPKVILYHLLVEMTIRQCSYIVPDAR
jgi:hypothetical protein